MGVFITDQKKSPAKRKPEKKPVPMKNRLGQDYRRVNNYRLFR
jgi:hypothetical protein